MTVLELQQALDVSPATIRRDLSEMETAGKVIRVRGAVVHPDYFRGEPSLAQKSRVASAMKKAIAVEAASLVPSGSRVLVDAGTTCLEVGRLLLQRTDITLVTHSLPLAMLAHESSASVLLIGGEVRAISGAAVGALAMSWLSNLRADWAFLGASGLDASGGASTTELSEAAMKQELLCRARHRVLVADSKKWESPATLKFAAWNEFEMWITDDRLTTAAVTAVRKQGPRVVRAAQK